MTEEKNSKSESKEEQPKNERKFNQDQYDRLLKCSKKGPEGIKEWNKWRKENPDEQIWLQGAELRNANLQGIIFHYAAPTSDHFLEFDHNRIDDLLRYYNRSANLQGANLYEANLEGADLGFADLQEANLEVANLEGAELQHTKLQRAKLWKANLQGANLEYANLQGAFLFETDLQGADLENGKLQGAELCEANLQGANLEYANLQGADLRKATLQGAAFMGVIVNGATTFLGCEIDEDTDFRHTALENVCIESGTKTLLKYNIRRMNWRDWYWGSRKRKIFDKNDDRPRRRACRVLWRLLITWPVRLFWKMSNYGRSTGRIMLTFVVLAIAFATVYLLWPCCVMVNNVVGDIRGFVHALYFSVVTMTTLGFGDIAANPDSWPGQVVLMVQVILGYVLLGALVTRLAVLFTADGPVGSYTPMDKETKELLAKLKEDKGN